MTDLQITSFMRNNKVTPGYASHAASFQVTEPQLAEACASELGYARPAGDSDTPYPTQCDQSMKVYDIETQIKGYDSAIYTAMREEKPDLLNGQWFAGAPQALGHMQTVRVPQPQPGRAQSYLNSFMRSEKQFNSYTFQ